MTDADGTCAEMHLEDVRFSLVDLISLKTKKPAEISAGFLCFI